MLYRPPPSPPPNGRRLLALWCLGVLVLAAGQVNALPKIQLGPAPGFLLVQDRPPEPARGTQEDRPAPTADLNAVLEDTRAKVEELFDATAIEAITKQRKQLEELKQDNERLATELERADAHRTELESSSEAAQARIAELSKALEVAVQEAARTDDELVGLRRQNAELSESLAQARNAGEAAQAEAEKTRADMEARLDAAADAAEQSTAKVAELHDALETTRQQLATANNERDRSVARVSEVEQMLERSGAEAERSKKELAAAKEQLSQAASAAAAAGRAREVASSEAEALRNEAAQVREELAAAKVEIGRFQTANSELKAANTELEKQIASWELEWRSAIEAARDNLILMEQKIDELKAALGVARPEERATPAIGPQSRPASAEHGRSTATREPSAKAQAQIPAPKTRQTGPDESSAGPTELSDTELSRWRVRVIHR